MARTETNDVSYVSICVRACVHSPKRTRSRDGKARAEKGAGAIHEAQSVDVCIGDVPVAATG